MKIPPYPELTKELRQFVVQNFLFGEDPGPTLTDSSSFLEGGIVDSTGVLELVTHLETAYGIKVPDDELVPDNLDSIDAVARYVERKGKGA